MIVILPLCAMAQKITHNFTATSLSDALAYIAKSTKEYRVNFIYNELEDFTVTTHVVKQSVPDAIRQIIGFYPMKMAIDEKDIYVECVQKSGTKFSGRVVDNLGQPMAFANIQLLNPTDSSFITGGVTNENGDFVIPCAAKEMIAKFSYIGFKTKFLTTSSKAIGTIRLRPEAQQLRNVIVEANRLNYRANGYKVNLTGSDLQNINSMSNLLAFLPAITINDGKINLLNSEPIIYVDGIKLNSQDELKAISPKSIKEISVDYLSVGEGAMNKGGIINITLRRASYNGMEGNASISATKMPYYRNLSQTSPSLAFSSNLGKLYLSGWAQYSYNNLIGDEQYKYVFNQSGISTETEQKTRSLEQYVSARLNASYAISERATIALSEYLSNDDVNDNMSGITHSSEQSNTATTNLIFGPRHYFTHQTTAKYIQQLDGKGSELNVTADYLYRKSHTTQQNLTNDVPQSETASGDVTQMYRMKPKLTFALGKTSRLQNGLDFRYIRNKNTLPSTNIIADSYTPSGFINYQTQIGKWGINGGFTLQYSDLEVCAYEVKNDLRNWYLCPQVSLMYMLNPRKNIMAMLNYQRSVEQMPYSLLNNYRAFDTPTHYTTGNTQLMLPTTHQLMLQLNLRGHVVITGVMMRRNDAIYFAHGVDENNPSLTYSRPMNSDYELGFGANVDFIYKPTKWWRTKASASFMKIKFEAPDLDNHSKPTGKFTWNNNLTFCPTFGGSATMYWETGTKFENYSWHPVGYVDASLWKTFFNNNLRLSLESVICAKGRRTRTLTDSYTSYYYNHIKPTSFTLTATWYFRYGKKVKQGVSAEQIQNYKNIKEKK